MESVLDVKHKYPIWLLKFGLLIALAYFIQAEMVKFGELKVDIQLFSSERIKSHGIYLLTCFGLLFFNLSTEAKKWRISTKSFLHQTRWQSNMAVLFGNTLGLVTPSKIGEYAGRLIHTSKSKSLSAIAANFYCSLSQNILNLLVGFTVFGLNSHFNSLVNRYLTSSFFTLGIAFTSILVLLYFNLKMVTTLLGKVRFLNSLIDKMGIDGFDGTVENNGLNKLLIWSLVRYMVYTTQYVMVCLFFDFEVNLWNLLCGIGFIFLIQSALILPPLLGLLARGEIAIIVWTIFGVSPDKIIVATVTLWFINILLPAILGLVAMMALRFETRDN